jgi:hypothetical protein
MNSIDYIGYVPHIGQNRGQTGNTKWEESGFNGLSKGGTVERGACITVMAILGFYCSISFMVWVGLDLRKRRQG